IPVGRQLASGSSFDCRASMICLADGNIGMVSPLARPSSRSPTGPPPNQIPEKSGLPSGSRGAGAGGRFGTVLATAPAPAGDVTAVGEFCPSNRAAENIDSRTITRNDFTSVLLLRLRAAVAGRSREHLAPVRQSHRARVRHIRAVLRL